jgi:hypothetical protein
MFLAPGLLGGFGLMAGECKGEVNKHIQTIAEPSIGAAPPTTSPERSQGRAQQIPGNVQQQSTDMCNGLAIQYQGTEADSDTNTDMQSIITIQTMLQLCGCSACEGPVCGTFEI